MFLVLAVVLIVVGYFAYVLIQYDRIDDKVSLDVLDNDKASDDAVTVGEIYTIVTQNIGFGAYLQDFTFFMGGGTESWGRSKEEVILYFLVSSLVFSKVYSVGPLLSQIKSPLLIS